MRKNVDRYPTPVLPRLLHAQGCHRGLCGLLRIAGFLCGGLLGGIVAAVPAAWALTPTVSPGPGGGPRKVVVIDAGHGGANLGAQGQALYEKQVTLAVAQRLGRILDAQGYRVVMTRKDDRYLTLRERVRRGNAASPAVFLSLHANASPDHSQRGVEAFVLDPSVAEVEARRLSRRAGGPVAALLSDVRSSLLLRESMRLGELVEDSLVSLRGSVDRGVRQGDYDVLAGVNAPAILVEMGFIDHVIEGPLLAEPAVQDNLAAAIAEGIGRYMAEPVQH